MDEQLIIEGAPRFGNQVCLEGEWINHVEAAVRVTRQCSEWPYWEVRDSQAHGGDSRGL